MSKQKIKVKVDQPKEWCDSCPEEKSKCKCKKK